MAAARCTFTSDDVVIKSPNDRRLYRYIELDNGLSAILVHDPDIYSDGNHLCNKSSVDDDNHEDDDDDDDDDGHDFDGAKDTGNECEDSHEDEDSDEELVETQGGRGQVTEKRRSCSSQTKMAAVAMCVGVGSFSDPLEAQGLAHFLEHMLFMGSTEFPDENEYDSFLSRHGGSTNAFTETEHTCYHFEVKHEFLKGALRRFSQFFVSPLMKMDAMEREVQAVDSEFNQIVQNDACRLEQVKCHTAAVGHPFNRFCWGNKNSLAVAMEKGINLREQILKLYKSYYYGGLMKLAVIGGETLDELENWVLELFCNVQKGSHVKSTIRMNIPIWKSGKLYRLEAVKDVHSLTLTWTLPSLRQEYLKKSEDYLAHLVGHEGKGSLHFFLKAKQWATSVSAGVGDDGMHRSSIAYIFSLTISLTDSGLDKVFEIIGFVYQYLKLLRENSPSEWIFKELQDIGNVEFRFVEEQRQDDYAAALAGNMFVYPVEDVIHGDYAYKVWDQDLIKYLLTFFTPDNMRIDVLSRSFGKLEDSNLEPWFGSRYAEVDVSPFLMELWRNPPEIDSSLHLPSKNEFIPCDFSLHCNSLSVGISNAFSPRCILDEPLMKLWYKLDNNFKIPRANTYFQLTLKGAYDNVKSFLLADLFIHLLKDELNEIIYQASVAKLETSLSHSCDKLELKIFGFNDKLPILLSRVLKEAHIFSPTDDRFKVIKEDLERALRNTNMKPLNHSTYLRLQVLCKYFWDVDEKIKLLDELTISDLIPFIPQLLSQIYVEGLCHGNMLEKEALEISNIFKNFLSTQPLSIAMRHKEQVLCLPSGANFVRDARVKNESESNSVVELYFQIEQEHGELSIKLKALLDLFDEIVEEPLFNQLRTKEQLGYVVHCSPRNTHRVLGFCVTVQSSKYNPEHLLERIDNFIDGLEELLLGLDNESFENYKSGLTAKLLEKDTSLTCETNRFWSQIVDGRYMFEMSKDEAEALKNIEKDEVIEWYRTYMRRISPKCRRLAVRVWGCDTILKETESETKHFQVIHDLAALKSSSTFYPVIL